MGLLVYYLILSRLSVRPNRASCYRSSNELKLSRWVSLSSSES
jgi:hypothetical protein